MLALLHERVPTLRRFSKAIVDQVDGWMEQHPQQVPVLHREWIAGRQGSSQAVEVLGSLAVTPPHNVSSADDWAWKKGYLAVFNAIVLFERGQGKRVEDLSRRWQLRDLDGVEERWRDDFLWLLSGIGQVLELRSFYYHLREDCSADAEQILQMKRLLRRMRHQTYELREQLKYCSPLGPVLHSIRRTRSGTQGVTVGISTIRKLEEAGIESVAQLSQMKVDEMVALGVRRDLAKQIHVYFRRRLQ